MSFTVRRPPPLPPAVVAAWSRDALLATLEGVAELRLCTFTERALLLGAFQRRVASASDVRAFTRGSGGPSVPVGHETLYVALALRHASALTPCPPNRLVNRYVRPLLRALTHLGAPASYFGRDTVHVKRRPVAWVGFAHESASGRACVEAFVHTRTLAEVFGRPIDRDALAQRIVAAFVAAYPTAGELRERDDVPTFVESALVEAPLEPAWEATLEEAIGPLAAGRDRAGAFRVGGDWMVSGDAVRRLEARLEALPVRGGHDEDRAAVGAVVNEVLASPGVLLEGVRSLESLCEVAVRARRLNDRGASPPAKPPCREPEGSS